MSRHSLFEGVLIEQFHCILMYMQIKQRRSSGDAEENILRFLQACTTLGIKKVLICTHLPYATFKLPSYTSIILIVKFAEAYSIFV